MMDRLRELAGGATERRVETLTMLGIVGIVGLMILPLRPWMLDILLALSITLGFVVLLTAVYMLRPLDFSVFPTVLLLTTLFRLGLNVASTRLILTGATEGRAEAGRVIQTFGDLVVGGSTVVGIVVFLILVIINFMVITKGAGRIAEVSARFTLDALPGKQMAIDAELANGALTEEGARKRRSELERESDFYGAMDGASKFVRGDAIAGLLITAINIIGGLIVASTQGGLGVGEAFRLYTLLTVGDGLVTQIPALLISTAAGVIVTRAAGGGALGDELSAQMLQDRRVLWGSAAAIGGLGLLPGMPMLLFLLLAGVLAGLAWQVEQSPSGARGKTPAEEVEDTAVPERTEAEEVREALQVQPLTLEIGLGLIGLVSESEDSGGLVSRVRQMRQTFAREMGVLIPPVRIRDNLGLAAGGYRLLLREVPIGEAELMPNRLLAIDPGGVRRKVFGVATREPTFGLEALWIAPQDRLEAEAAGYTVVDLEGVIMTHVSDLVRQHASELFGWQELHERLDQLREEAPRLVSDLVPDAVPHATLLRVLRELLSEGLSVRDLRGILEALAERSGSQASISALVDHVRARLRDQISMGLAGEDGALRVAMLDRPLEEELRRKLLVQDGEPHLACDLHTAQLLFEQLEAALPAFGEHDAPPVLLAPADLRQPLKVFLSQFFPQLAVVSHREIPSRRRLVAIARLGAGGERGLTGS